MPFFQPSTSSAALYSFCAEKLCQRFDIPLEDIPKSSNTANKTPFELLVGGYLSLELQEFRSRVYLVGVIIEKGLIPEDAAMNLLLETQWRRLGGSQAVLAWEADRQRLILWQELRQPREKIEDTFEDIVSKFLKDLDFWIGILPLPQQV